MSFISIHSWFRFRVLTWLTRDKTGRPTWQKARSSRTTSCHQDSVESSGVLRAGAVPSHTLDRSNYIVGYIWFKNWYTPVYYCRLHLSVCSFLTCFPSNLSLGYNSKTVSVNYFIKISGKQLYIVLVCIYTRFLLVSVPTVIQKCVQTKCTPEYYDFSWDYILSNS